MTPIHSSLPLHSRETPIRNTHIPNRLNNAEDFIGAIKARGISEWSAMIAVSTLVGVTGAVASAYVKTRWAASSPLTAAVAGMATDEVVSNSITSVLSDRNFLHELAQGIVARIALQGIVQAGAVLMGSSLPATIALTIGSGVLINVGSQALAYYVWNEGGNPLEMGVWSLALMAVDTAAIAAAGGMTHAGLARVTPATISSQNQSSCTPHSEIAIIGNGASGTLLTIQLIEQAKIARTPIKIKLIEERPIDSRGVAYSTQDSSHLLNVRAKSMSAFADSDRANDFYVWAHARYANVTPNDFLPRQLYGKYLEEKLQDAINTKPDNVELQRIQGKATDLKELKTEKQLGHSIEFADGTKVFAHQTVLAFGNFAPRVPAEVDAEVTRSNFFTSEPLVTEKYLETNGSVLLIGSGLTAVDTALSINARGKAYNVTMISPSGKLPRTHKDINPYSIPNVKEFVGQSPYIIQNMLNAAIQKTRQSGFDHRSVIDGLRGVTNDIWKSWNIYNKRIFARDMLSDWNHERHRVPPQSAETLSQMAHNSKLTQIQGRLLGVLIDPTQPGVLVRYQIPGRDTFIERHFDHVVNCTGPERDYSRIDKPLVKNLLENGLIKPNEMKWGLEVNDDGQVLGADAMTHGLWTLGPPLLGKLLETTAIPEIRGQAQSLAGKLLVTGAQLMIR